MQNFIVVRIEKIEKKNEKQYKFLFLTGLYKLHLCYALHTNSTYISYDSMKNPTGYVVFSTSTSFQPKSRPTSAYNS